MISTIFEAKVYFVSCPGLRCMGSSATCLRRTNARAAVQLLRCEMAPDETPFDTAEFVKNIQVISIMKQNLSDTNRNSLQAVAGRNRRQPAEQSSMLSSRYSRGPSSMRLYLVHSAHHEERHCFIDDCYFESQSES
jgi:hypothetical protein